MKCIVCGNDVGLFTRLASRADVAVCKSCREQGHNQLQVLVQSVNAVQTFKPQLASGWLTQFQQGVQKYRMPESDAAPLRFALLDNIFKLVEAEDPIPDDDIKYVASLANAYMVSESGITELQDTCVRLAMQKQIQVWEAGTIPHLDCGGLILQKGEVCHWEQQAALRVRKMKREYVGAYSSVSVPVPLMRGVRVRVGGFKGHPIDQTVLEDGGLGTLHITNQRVAFTGPIAVARLVSAVSRVGLSCKPRTRRSLESLSSIIQNSRLRCSRSRPTRQKQKDHRRRKLKHCSERLPNDEADFRED
jgi:hypothetical protein